MSKLFLSIINMSLTAGYTAMIIILVRLLMKKLPKIYSYLLWGVVLFRLICPFSFESLFSLIPKKVETVKNNLIIAPQSTVGKTGITDLGNRITGSLPSIPHGTANQSGILNLVIEKAFVIWIIGMIIMTIYGLYSYFKLKKNLREATLIEANIYETDRINGPFVLGILRPRIYIPAELSISEKEYVLKHEQVHIRRKDYLIKPVAFLALSLHWFNPLIWLSYYLMSKDMEMSCDENVMKQSEQDIRIIYSKSLLSLAVKQNGFFIPLAFSESKVKSRIKNILKYKKPAFWIVLLSMASVITITILLIANPRKQGANASSARAVTTDDTERNKRNQEIEDDSTGTVINSIYPNDPEELYEIYKKALEESDYNTIMAVTPGDNPSPDGQKIWDTIKISEVKLLKKDVRDNKACYSLELNIKDGGNSAFEAGIFPRWLWMVKGEQGWYVEGLMTSGEPEENWWNQETANASEDTKIQNAGQADSKTIETIDKLLSDIMSTPKLSSNTSDYIEANQEEYDRIRSMSGEALPYLMDILYSDDHGLGGNIVKSLCDGIIDDYSKKGNLNTEEEKLIKETKKAINFWNGNLEPKP